MRALRPILLCAASLAVAAAHPPSLHRLTDRAVRAFVDRQERLWNARDFAGYFALAAPEAVFITERTTPDGQVSTERETVAESRRSAERVFAGMDSFHEATFVDRIVIAPDGRSARVLGHEQAEVVRGATGRRLCADTEQRLALRHGRILSLGQTDRLRICEPPRTPLL